jgi:hypothetical protein
MQPDSVSTVKTETYQVNVLDRAILIARLLLSRKRSGSIKLCVSQGTVCAVQWEEKEK